MRQHRDPSRVPAKTLAVLQSSREKKKRPKERKFTNQGEMSRRSRGRRNLGQHVAAGADARMPPKPVKNWKYAAEASESTAAVNFFIAERKACATFANKKKVKWQTSSEERTMEGATR